MLTTCFNPQLPHDQAVYCNVMQRLACAPVNQNQACFKYDVLNKYFGSLEPNTGDKSLTSSHREYYFFPVPVRDYFQ